MNGRKFMIRNLRRALLLWHISRQHRLACMGIAVMMGACSSQSDPNTKSAAARSLSDINAIIASTSADAARVLPGQLADVQRQIGELQASFDQKHYDAVAKSAPWVMSEAQRLANAINQPTSPVEARQPSVDTDRKPQNASKTAQTNASYIDSLREKYDARIIYSSPEAELAIKAFQIDCHAPDKRVLPLLNVLYAKIQDADSPTIRVTEMVLNRGDETRIYDVATTKGGATYQQVSFELNKWGELHSIGARPAAILNACYGTYGPIWVMPEQEQGE